MQDPENPRKRSRIRTKVQNTSSRHAFSLSNGKGGESIVRVDVAESDKNDKSTSSSELSHFEQFVRDHENRLSQNVASPSPHREKTAQEVKMTKTPEQESYKRPPLLEERSTSQKDFSSPRDLDPSREEEKSGYSKSSQSFRTPRYRRSPAMAPRFATSGNANNDFPEEGKGRYEIPEVQAITARDFQDTPSYNNKRKNDKYSISSRRGNYRNFKEKGKRRSGSQPFEIQPAANFVPSYPEEKINSTEPIRLNKYLANSGLYSRRNADLLIAEGKIKVNGEVVTTMGVEITRQDIVEYNGKRVEIEPRIYVLLNKPKNCMTTSDDPEGRMTVLDLVKNACSERIYPVGRLDRNTTGVLLLTNDGDMMAKLLHPSFRKKKIYQVTLDRPVEVEHMQQIAQGIELPDGEIHADAISYVDETDFSIVGIEIHSGRNRIVRRIFEHFGYKIYKLDRVYFAGLTKRNLPRGRWRYLSEEEVSRLRMGNYE